MMFTSTVLTTLIAAGSAHAAVIPGWGVRADFTSCDSATPLEVVLDGATNQLSPAANITDFKIPIPFDGTLVIKAAGAVGYGSPYPPQQIQIEIFSEGKPGDPPIWGNATVKPGTGQPASIVQIGWNTGGNLTIAPDQNEEVFLQSWSHGGSLVVDYCGVPASQPPYT
ncbi:hypothetical protein KVR01_012828 [Diaporthe batatas]|uniref:uncharacterized protein n=1 Tax=Diaporthe batatas TaxID=748121 RepID=UPI001D045CA6|nr:uncharacterized protein KVR01_012828 [Diaporthe batatas]KAG8157444.1 hypothetical protein KVR01_012828 [Diaporthe batatas]